MFLWTLLQLKHQNSFNFVRRGSYVSANEGETGGSKLGDAPEEGLKRGGKNRASKRVKRRGSQRRPSNCAGPDDEESEDQKMSMVNVVQRRPSKFLGQDEIDQANLSR